MLTQAYAPLFIQVEVVSLIIVGMIALILDRSFITFGKDIEKVWAMSLDPYKFPPMNQMYLKYIISLLIVIRTLTLHITIAMYVVMLWPAVFAERPSLLLPWLIVGTTRVCADFLATFVGLYICSAYGLLSTLWIEFLIVQLLQHGPFFYIWLTITKYRVYLIEVRELYLKRFEMEIYKVKKRGKSRQRVWERRRTIDVSEQNRSTQSQSTISTIIEHISNRNRSLTTRSLDTLLEIIEGYKESSELLSLRNEDRRSDKEKKNEEEGEDEEEGDAQSKLMKKLQIDNEYLEKARQIRSVPSPDLSDYVSVDSSIIDSKPRVYRSSSVDDIFSDNRLTDKRKRPSTSKTIEEKHSEVELKNIKLNSKTEIQSDKGTK